MLWFSFRSMKVRGCFVEIFVLNCSILCNVLVLKGLLLIWTLVSDSAKWYFALFHLCCKSVSSDKGCIVFE